MRKLATLRFDLEWHWKVKCKIINNSVVSFFMQGTVIRSIEILSGGLFRCLGSLSKCNWIKECKKDWMSIALTIRLFGQDELNGWYREDRVRCVCGWGRNGGICGGQTCISCCQHKNMSHWAGGADCKCYNLGIKQLTRVQCGMNDWQSSCNRGPNRTIYGKLFVSNVLKCTSGRARVFINPAHASHGGVYYFACVPGLVSVRRPSVCLLLTKYLKKYWTDQLHFWWNPSGLWPREETIRFWKGSWGKGMCGGVENLALMIRDRRKNFEWL